MLNPGAMIHSESASLPSLAIGFPSYQETATPDSLVLLLLPSVFQLSACPSLFISHLNADCLYICLSTSPKMLYVLP